MNQKSKIQKQSKTIKSCKAKTAAPEVTRKQKEAYIKAILDNFVAEGIAEKIGNRYRLAKYGSASGTGSKTAKCKVAKCKVPSKR